MAGREEEVQEGSRDGRWLCAPRSHLALLHCCHSSVHANGNISTVQLMQRVWGPALSIQTLSLLTACIWSLFSGFFLLQVCPLQVPAVRVSTQAAP